MVADGEVAAWTEGEVARVSICVTGRSPSSHGAHRLDLDSFCLRLGSGGLHAGRLGRATVRPGAICDHESTQDPSLQPRAMPVYVNACS